MKAKRFQKIAKKVFKVVAEEYQEYFEEKMEKHDIDSPADLSDEEKSDFFNEVDEDWDAENETD